MRLASVLALLLLIGGACAPSSEAIGSPSAAPSAASTPSAAALRYEESELFSLERDPVGIAVTESQVFVAEIASGARPSDVRGWVVSAPLTGGRPTVVPGSDTPADVGILGLTYRDGLYLSRASNSDLSMTGVFHLTLGQLTPVAGGFVTTLSNGNGDGGPAMAAAVQGPWGIAFSKTGDLYIAEYGDSRVRVVRDGVITTYAGNGLCGTTIPQSGDAKATSICNPALLTIDPDGVVYTGQRVGAQWIVRIDPTGTLTTITTAFPIGGLAIDGRSLIVADAANGMVVAFRVANPTRPEVLASGLGIIRALAIGSDGSLYIARSRNSGGSWSVARLRPVR